MITAANTLAIRKLIPRRVKQICKRVLRRISMLLLSGDAVHCPVCDWKGRRLMDGGWHERSICPCCRSDTRHRLLKAGVLYLPQFHPDTFLAGKDILHFAPARPLQPFFRKVARRYVTADLERADVDLRLDIGGMEAVESESYDRLIAFDVLEHVQEDAKAIEEIHRILKPGGAAILSVPQKDGLLTTYEDPNITTPDGRRRAFGEPNHLRLYGADFEERVASRGFVVEVIDEGQFESEAVSRHVLKPPTPGRHPLATNHRKIFFCHKQNRSTAGESVP